MRDSDVQREIDRMTKNRKLMNRFDKQIYESGLIAQGCWDKFDDYDKQALNKFAELIVRDCAEIAYKYDAPKMSGPGMIIAGRIETHFGVEE